MALQKISFTKGAAFIRWDCSCRPFITEPVRPPLAPAAEATTSLALHRLELGRSVGRKVRFRYYYYRARAVWVGGRAEKGFNGGQKWG